MVEQGPEPIRVTGVQSNNPMEAAGQSSAIGRGEAAVGARMCEHNVPDNPWRQSRFAPCKVSGWLVLNLGYVAPE